MYDEELSLHKSILHLSDYLELSEQERSSDNIYFIDDVVSDEDLINQLITIITNLRAELVSAGLLNE